ncbi:MAG: hypothetical protein JSS14_30030 [Proteobacteria bacterium]|nr:hypothetical protein [Pseudomonadota bacterium]
MRSLSSVLKSSLASDAMRAISDEDRDIVEKAGKTGIKHGPAEGRGRWTQRGFGYYPAFAATPANAPAFAAKAINSSPSKTKNGRRHAEAHA